MSANDSPVHPSLGTSDLSDVSGVSGASSGGSFRTSPAEQSDAALISRVRAGDGAAYELLYERHIAAARTLARHLAGGAAAANRGAAHAAAESGPRDATETGGDVAA